MDRDKAVKKMLQYYKLTADEYDDMHPATKDDKHVIAFSLISGFLKLYDFKSILDVGCGTGRALTYFAQNHPNLLITRVDLSVDLLTQLAKKNIPINALLCGNAYHLPFKDSSFDIVLSSALLHHVPNPRRVVEEMLRVARKAIFISDTNRYGQGSLLKKLIKLSLYKVLRMGKIVDYIRTGGKCICIPKVMGSFTLIVFLTPSVF